MATSSPRITLLTDFGTSDGYVGAMKGVIAGILPHAHIDDIAHDLPAGHVDAGAWALGAYWNRYPAGTVHVVVVDPGVGTQRHALAIEADGRFLIGPDNGVLSWALRDAERAGAIHSIRPPDDVVVSATFHGRDVFAPAAARLAAGEDVAFLGPRVEGIVRLPWPEPVRHARGIDGTVCHVDRYGNLITNIPADRATGECFVRVGSVKVQVRRAYGDVERGELVAYAGSRGLLEIALRDGSAAERLGGKGRVVALRAVR